MMIAGFRSERGAVLVLALMGTTVMMALGAALVVVATTETIVAANFRSGRQAFYAAEAIAEVAIAELLVNTNWTGILEGTERSRFVDGVPQGARGLPADAPVNLTVLLNLANCGAPAPCGGVPRWQLFAYGPVQDLTGSGGSDVPFYGVALVSAGSAASGDPRLTLRAESFGPRGARQAIEVVMVRTAAGAAAIERTVFSRWH